jgi:hypothetical protein
MIMKERRNNYDNKRRKETSMITKEETIATMNMTNNRKTPLGY